MERQHVNAHVEKKIEQNRLFLFSCEIKMNWTVMMATDLKLNGHQFFLSTMCIKWWLWSEKPCLFLLCLLRILQLQYSKCDDYLFQQVLAWLSRKWFLTHVKQQKKQQIKWLKYGNTNNHECSLNNICVV